MRRRLRKKKHLGEFTLLGFEMEGDLRPELARPEEDAFIELVANTGHLPGQGSWRGKMGK